VYVPEILLLDGFEHGSEIAEAQMGDVTVGTEVVVAPEAFGLEFAEFGGAFVEQTVGEGTGAVDGELEFGGGVGLHGVGGVVGGFRSGETFFDLGAAAQTPRSATNFVEEIEFERAAGREVDLKFGGEFGPGGFFAGADEVAGGEEAESYGVSGRDCFAGFGDGAGGGLGVDDVGCDLGFGGHFVGFLSGGDCGAP